MEEKKKMGRPTTDPKSTMFRVRISDNDIKKLDFCQSVTKKTKSDIIRQGIDIIYQKLKKSD